MLTIRLYKGNTEFQGVLFGDGLKLSIQRESNERFYRRSIEHEVHFIGEAYTALYSSRPNEKFRIEVSNDAILLASAELRKTDCVFDTDNLNATYNIGSVDKYTTLLERKGDKYNIVSLLPKVESIEMNKRTIIQLYMWGDTKITNIIGNMSYEVDAEETRDDGKLGSCAFSFIQDYSYFDFAFDIAGYTQYKGRWEKVDNSTRYSGRYRHSSGAYFDMSASIGERHNIYNADGSFTGMNIRAAYEGYPLEVQIGSVATNEVSFAPRLIYTRMLTDKSINEMSIKRADDITASNLNYRYATPYAVLPGVFLNDRFRVSTEVQDEPTQWGTNSEGKYFVQFMPALTEGYNEPRVVPIARSLWSPQTFWFINDVALAQAEDIYNTPFELKDAYTLQSVLEKLVEKATNGAMTEVVSEFLFSPTNPMNRFMRQKYFVTPITNIKKTYYDQAAQRGDISLDDILAMLKATFNCYWFIEGNALRIEHVSWFINGGAYYGSIIQDAIDITKMKCPLPDKMWGYGVNQFQYNLNQPRRTEFKWGTDCTEEFNGYPFEVTEEYMENGTTKTLSAGGFVADVDLCIAQPNSLPDDSFVILKSDSNNKMEIVGVPYAKMGSGTKRVFMQNGYLSFTYLAQTWHRYGISGEHYTINDMSFYNGVVARMVSQSVRFPIDFGDIGENALIRTDLGIGEVEKMEIDCDNMVASCDLLLPMR